MNLRQIIRNQKTQKFDLTSLVSSVVNSLNESSTGSSSGDVATSSTWATIKSLYEGVISEQSKIPALKNGQLTFFETIDTVTQEVKDDVSKFELDKERFLNLLTKVEDDVLSQELQA